MSRLRTSTVLLARVSESAFSATTRKCTRCSLISLRETDQRRIYHFSSHSRFHIPTSTLTVKRANSSSSHETQEATQKAYNRLRPILDNLPKNIDWGVAYGSGVIHQANASSGPPPMTDFLISTSDPISFHRENLCLNPRHYPLWARVCGATIVASVQDEMGAEMWYVTMVHLNGLEVKYGVINTRRLLQDLDGWSTLYVAGRLHKPVLTLRSTPEISKAQTENLKSALTTSLLQLPARFTEYQLWEQIAGLSYSGDPRMSVPGAENPEKVKNIVRGDGNLQGFRDLYRDVICSLNLLRWENGSRGLVGEVWEGSGEEVISRDEVDVDLLIEHLPPRVQSALKEKLPDFKVIIGSSKGSPASIPEFQKALASVLKDIIHRPALVQSMKGLLTAGFTKSVYYSLAKFRKWLKARQSKKGRV